MVCYDGIFLSSRCGWLISASFVPLVCGGDADMHECMAQDARACLLQIGYFHGFIDGVDYVFVDHACFHGWQGNIYGGDRQQILFRYPLHFCTETLSSSSCDMHTVRRLIMHANVKAHPIRICTLMHLYGDAYIPCRIVLQGPRQMSLGTLAAGGNESDRDLCPESRQCSNAGH